MKWCGVVLLMLLAACASNPPQSESHGREAARINASLGQEYMSRGQLEIALDKLKRAVAADPAYAPAQTLLAVLYERIDKPELAERHYRLAVDAAPEGGDVNNNFGVYLCQAGRYPEAVPHFMTAVKDPFYRTPEVAYANAGSCALQAGDLDNAERYLRQSLEYDAEFPDALLSLAQLSVRRGDFFRARAFLQRFESTGMESSASLFLGYRVENRLENKAAADAYRARLLTEYPNSKETREIRNSHP
ncbi:MAG: type IV pilus biogenesis/stability protein PilW [Xanthomonadales bacterium]|nr:type IV pilus biogenesis/stability protein PilW [Xanthomonadales bacterium]